MDALNPTVASLRKRGRPSGSKNRTVFSRSTRDLVSVTEKSGPARFFRRAVRDIEADLGGRRHLSRIEGELIRTFAGAATLLQYQNVQIALGESTELDPQAYATLASTILRIGRVLGCSDGPGRSFPRSTATSICSIRKQLSPSRRRHAMLSRRSCHAREGASAPGAQRSASAR